MPSDANPLVTAILPVRNGERFIGDALQSVHDQALGTSVELIVIDDGSADASLGIVRRRFPEAICLETPGLGPAGARNAGLRRARGQFVSFIDHDDLWPQGKLRAHLAHFAEDPDCEISYGRVRYDLLPGGRMPDIDFTHPDQSLYAPHLGSFMMRSHVFDRLGLLAEDMIFCEDVDFFNRMLESDINIVALDKVSLIYRLHDNNMTRDRSKAIRGYLEAQSRSIRRQRSANARTMV